MVVLVAVEVKTLEVKERGELEIRQLLLPLLTQMPLKEIMAVQEMTALTMAVAVVGLVKQEIQTVVDSVAMVPHRPLAVRL
jgi:cysteine sulfinate desulfinase/cysteine desulfurase-like protein